MSMSRVTAILAVLCGTWACTIPAAAQHELHNVPPVISPQGDNADYFQPFIDPNAFDPDFQFFAPADIDTYGDGPEPNIGWFATYDRVRIWVTRPDHVPSYTEGDFTWGNRFDLGYMSEEEHGWLVSIWHIDGPVAFDVLTQERVNVYEEDDEINGTPDAIILRGGGGGGGGTTDTTLTPGYPLQDRNDPITGQRDYRVHNSLNVADLTSLELNKTIRANQKHYGSFVEPFCGLRYIKMNSVGQAQQYVRYDEETALPAPIVLPIPLADAQNATIEQLISDTSVWTNHMVGGQLGMRWFKQKSRWILSSDVRAFAFQNFQNFTFNEEIITTYYDGIDLGADVITEAKARSGFNAHDAEFVFGTEIRAEAAFAISKALTLRSGLAYMHFGRGVARGVTEFDNSEDVVMIGYTFGATLNR